jgi:hypothetical protein
MKENCSYNFTCENLEDFFYLFWSELSGRLGLIPFLNKIVLSLGRRVKRRCGGSDSVDSSPQSGHTAQPEPASTSLTSTQQPTLSMWVVGGEGVTQPSRGQHLYPPLTVFTTFKQHTNYFDDFCVPLSKLRFHQLDFGNKQMVESPPQLTPFHSVRVECGCWLSIIFLAFETALRGVWCEVLETGSLTQRIY